LWMVVDGAVASWRLVWRHAADEHGAVRRARWPPLMAVGLWARGVVRLYRAGPADRVGYGACGGVAGCNHAAIDALAAIWPPSVGSFPMASVLETEMKPPWSRAGGPSSEKAIVLACRGSNPEDVAGGSTMDRCDVFPMYNAPLPRPSVATSPPPFHGSSTRHSKVIVMLEDEQRSLGALEPVAAILYLPDADGVWFCCVPHH
jgi:hypothetical protein